MSTTTGTSTKSARVYCENNNSKRKTASQPGSRNETRGLQGLQRQHNKDKDEEGKRSLQEQGQQIAGHLDAEQDKVDGDADSGWRA